jgi:coenzyme Q-binding protein COQ10
MGHGTIRGHVNAPIEQVFDYAVDFNRTAEWNVSVVKMEPGPPLARVGDRFKGTMKLAGRIYEGEGEVTAIERPRMFAFVSTSPMGGHQNWTSRLTPSGSGTDIESDIDYEVPGSILGKFADKLFIEREVQRMLDQSRDNFIAMVEHRALQPA